VTRPWGPLELVLPADPDPCPGVNWQQLYDLGQAHDHQDSQDRLNADRTWGTNDTQAPGGSGIAFAYSQPDIDCVRVACKGWKNNPIKPNPEHSWRDGVYYMAGFEETHDVHFARGVQSVAQRCTTYPWFSLTGDISLDDPGNRPQNLDCLLAETQARPHQGMRFLNLRAYGNALYWKAAEHKCARVLGAPIDPTWMVKALSVLEAAALPTGALFCGTEFDPQHPLDQVQSEYTMHWAFTAMGAMACAKRLHQPIPSWILPHMDALDALPPMIYAPYGATSLPSFTYTDGDVLRVATGSGQNGDPAFGWWSSVCVAISGFFPSPRAYWLERAKHWGPWQWDGADEQTRKFTMLYRGAAGT